MITLRLGDGSDRRFNLKSIQREREFRAAWRSMRGDDKYKGKKFKITTDEDVELIKINDIIRCEFDEAKLVKGDVSGSPSS